MIMLCCFMFSLQGVIAKAIELRKQQSLYKTKREKRKNIVGIIIIKLLHFQRQNRGKEEIFLNLCFELCHLKDNTYMKIVEAMNIRENIKSKQQEENWNR